MSLLSFNGACKSVRLKEGEGIARQARDIDIHVHQRNAPATILGQMFSAVWRCEKTRRSGAVWLPRNGNGIIYRWRIDAMRSCLAVCVGLLPVQGCSRSIYLLPDGGGSDAQQTDVDLRPVRRSDR